MGLAASQARLLTITARKSDCEYQSMSYSHQKIALSRDMNIVSSQYEAALNKTKLVYDFYGSGDKSTQLSYGLLMQPSKLNDFRPSPITDQVGRIVLDSSLAAAARAAGIPQEGLGTTPSSDIRNAFVEGLVSAGVVTPAVGKGIQNVQYNPNAGFGDVDVTTTRTESVTLADFINDYIGDIECNFSDLTLDAGGSTLYFRDGIKNADYALYDNSPEASMTVTLKDLLDPAKSYSLYGHTWGTENTLAFGGVGCVIDKVASCSYWDMLADSLGQYINPDDKFAQAALEYAYQQTMHKLENLCEGKNYDLSNAALSYKYSHSSLDEMKPEVKKKTEDYVGYVYIKNKKYNDNGYKNGYALNLSNMTQAYFTYFAQYMQGLGKSDYKVTNEKSTSKFVTSDSYNFAFDIVTDPEVNGDNLLIANFYDTLFNQIALNGWVTNDNVKDTEYLQTMLQNGSMYISTLGDDSYYYQSNYSINSYIKEITDEEGIAAAEQKYNREKTKIKNKENIIDMKMKNLDTEISALNTEYDSIKSVISKSIDKGFKRYDA